MLFRSAPTAKTAYENGLQPLINQEISEEEAWHQTTKPFAKFMQDHTRKSDQNLFVGIAKKDKKQQAVSDDALHILIPAFMLSELKKAFEIGFLIYLPFLIIDLVIASVLMAMGMMMLPPVIISLPFKLVFFVLIDGWHMLCGSLMKSYGFG